MNAVHRVVFNAGTGVWQVVSEIARGRCKASRKASGLVVPAIGLLVLFSSNSAWSAVCPASPVITNCTNHYEALENINVTVSGTGYVNSDAATTTPAMWLEGNAITLTNSGGTITSDTNGRATTGLKVVGNGSSPKISITNSGWITGSTAGVTGSVLADRNGMAMDVEAGTGGRITIVNENVIRLNAISGATVNDVNQVPNVTVHGGAQVVMTNKGWIEGGIAFAASVEGNVFTNENVLYGSLSLGAGGGANRFNAVTGSTVPSTTQSTPIYITDSTQPGLAFVSKGFVDGGAGGSNILALQNAIGGVLAPSQVGEINAANYINFANLLVEGGRWRVYGALLNGAVPSSARLSGGELEIDNNGVFGNGAVTFDGGTLTAATPISLVNPIHIAGTGTVQNNEAMTFSGVLSGSGALTKTGAGTLSLTGSSTFSGSTNISDGTLEASAASLGTGSILNQASLRLNQTSDGTLGQAISGTGSITKTGAGTLTLTGDSSAFAGPSTFQAGGLHMGSTGSLGGSLSFARGTTLSGTGAVGSPGRITTMRSGSMVTPGDAATPYGALRVAGDLVFQSGTGFQVKTDPGSSHSSRIEVAGRATLGGQVHHVASTASYAATRDYTILSAAGGVQGSFASVVSDFAYLDGTLVQPNPTDVVLRFVRKDIAFSEPAITPNQKATANGIESLPSNSALYRFVEALPAGTPAATFDSLSGEIHASLASSLATLSGYVPRVSSQHLLRNLNPEFCLDPPPKADTPQPQLSCSMHTYFPAWVEVLGDWQRYDGDGNAAQMKQRTAGIFLGMDQEVGRNGWRLGGALGYSQADGKVAERSAQSTVHSYSAAIYGGKSFGPGQGPRLNVLGGMAYTWHDIETARHVQALGKRLQADYSARTAQLFGELGYLIGQYDTYGVEPFVAVSVGQQRTRGFSESGGFAALSGQSRTDDLAHTTLGVRLTNDFQWGRKDGRLRTSIGWRHAFGDVTPTKSMAFDGGQNFRIDGMPQARDTAVLNIEANIEAFTGQTVVLGYQGEIGGGQRNHSAHVKLRWAF